MKYMPLDLSVMQPEPFPHPVMMRSDLYARRQPSREEKWGICPGSVCGALRVLVRRCREEAERRKLAMSILSVAGACVFGLMAVGVFWLAVALEFGRFRPGGAFLLLIGLHDGRQIFRGLLSPALQLRFHFLYHARAYSHFPPRRFSRTWGSQPFFRNQAAPRQQKQVCQHRQQKACAPGNPEQSVSPPLPETHGGKVFTVP